MKAIYVCEVCDFTQCCKDHVGATRREGESVLWKQKVCEEEFRRRDGSKSYQTVNL